MSYWKSAMSMAVGSLIALITVFMADIIEPEFRYFLLLMIPVALVIIGLILRLKTIKDFEIRMKTAETMMKNDNFLKSYEIYKSLALDCLEINSLYYKCKLGEAISLSRHAYLTGIDEETNLHLSIALLEEIESKFSKSAFDYFILKKYLATGYMNLAQIRNKKDNLDKAKQIFETITFEPFISDTFEYSGYLLNRGVLYFEYIVILPKDEIDNYLKLSNKYYLMAKEVIEKSDNFQNDERLRLNYSRLHINLGTLYGSKKEAKTMYNIALTYVKPEINRKDYALAKMNLAIREVQSGWVQKKEAIPILNDGIMQFNISTLQAEKSSEPKTYARATECLALAYMLKSKVSTNVDDYQKSYDYFNEALQFFSCDRYPYRWATIQKNRCGLLLIGGFDLGLDVEDEIESTKANLQFCLDMFKADEYRIKHDDFLEHYNKLNSVHKLIQEKRDSENAPPY